MRSLGRINKTDVAARDSLGDTTAAPPSGKWIPAAFVPKSAQQPWEFWTVPAALASFAYMGV